MHSRTQSQISDFLASLQSSVAPPPETVAPVTKAEPKAEAKVEAEDDDLDSFLDANPFQSSARQPAQTEKMTEPDAQQEPAEQISVTDSPVLEKQSEEQPSGKPAPLKFQQTKLKPKPKPQ